MDIFVTCTFNYSLSMSQGIYGGVCTEITSQFQRLVLGLSDTSATTSNIFISHQIFHHTRQTKSSGAMTRRII